jgi:serine protease inhibitor
LNETHFPLIRSALTQTNQNERIRLTIPKSSTTVELDLKENLLNVAPQIAPLFSPDQADLSNALPGAYVQNLIQHVRIDFLEDGMEAAAITSADIGVTSAPTPAKVSLTLDRSYLYFVLNGQGLILFSGVMNQPSI